MLGLRAFPSFRSKFLSFRTSEAGSSIVFNVGLPQVSLAARGTVSGWVKDFWIPTSQLQQGFSCRCVLGQKPSPEPLCRAVTGDHASYSVHHTSYLEPSLESLGVDRVRAARMLHMGPSGNRLTAAFKVLKQDRLQTCLAINTARFREHSPSWRHRP